MLRQPNPLDPLDEFKRWYAALWPMQRWLFWLATAAVVWGLLLYVTR